MTTNILTTRRDFLVGSAAATGALVIGFTLTGAARYAQAGTAAPVPLAPNAFLRITPDGQITVICGLSEMGQGVHMGIAMLVAEELDADWKRVRLEQAPADPAYVNPMLRMQGTGGSTSIRAAGADAQGRRDRTPDAVRAAADTWGAEPADCRTQTAASCTRTVARSATASSSRPQRRCPCRPTPRSRIEGLPHPRQGLTRLDTPAKVNGSAGFGIDTKLPGMLTP